jgi:hypothetical protein
MIDIDESELIGFFGVLSTPQPREEQEFFGTTIFDVHQGDLHLSLSVSKYHADLVIYLHHKPANQRLLSLHLPGLQQVRVERLPDSASELRCRAVAYARTSTSERDVAIAHEVTIRLDPAISIRAKTHL